MDVAYASTFHIKNREVFEDKNSEEILATLIETNAYVSVLINGQYSVLDMKRLHFKTLVSIDETLTISNFLENHLTDMLYVTLSSSESFPLKSVSSGKFENRVETFDPHTLDAYKVEYTSIQTPDIRNNVNLKDWLYDLVISTSDDTFLEHCLVSVNGVLHRTIYHNEELYVSQGYANMKTSNLYETLVIDTSKVGGHEIVDITEDMILNTETESLLKGIRLKMPSGVSLKDKSVLLSIHGRLCVFDTFYKVTGKTSIKIDINKFDGKHFILNHPLTRWSRQYRSPGNFPLEGDLPSNSQQLSPPWPEDSPLYTNFIDEGGRISASYLNSEQFVRDLLASRHSFIILINTSTLFKRTFDLEPTFVPGIHTGHHVGTPRGILTYNDLWTLPYTILSSQDRYHTLMINSRRFTDDISKTIENPEVYIAPWFNLKLSDHIPHVKLTELYVP